ncbi:MAG: penicillin acylase family protein [Bryobacterales bacterium]|nr:penicillin acylase family protein [Bryobacterales bacterium]
MAAVAALSLTWWTTRRVLPATSGEILTGVRAPVTITRDAEHVAHIRAANVEDALFAQGYLTAQERLFQMDYMRRQAAGELAAIFGSRALTSDTEMRRLRMRRAAAMHAANLNPIERQALAAYARGVNRFLEENSGRLPVEFTLLEYDPAPWSITDSILIGLEMARTLSLSFREEILKSGLLSVGEPALVQQLFPLRTGLEPQPGSNAWAISGTHTQSGKPLLSGDPHLQFTLPGIWYQIHLQAPGLDVTGASLPGAPAVIIGHNADIAWSNTNLHFDVSDLYKEQVNLAAGVTRFENGLDRVRVEQEVIAVRGGRPVTIAVASTRHGPLMGAEGNQQLALRWNATEPGGFSFPFLELNMARNWSEFRAALSRFAGPAQNYVYADREGNIGYQAAGRLPIRDGYAGDVPVDGASGKFEWKGFIPFEDLPSAFNPPSGIIVTANENPFPPNYRYPVSGYFSPHYRAAQIQARLRKRAKWDAAGMASVQRDVYSAFHHYLAGELARLGKARGSANPKMAEASDLLANWNGLMEPDAAQPYIVKLTYEHLRRAIVDRAAPGRGVSYNQGIGYAVVERLLRQRPKEWFGDFDALLLRAFTAALEEGDRVVSLNPGRWRYGPHNQLKLSHPLLGDVKWIGGLFTIGPAPMPGAPTTVFQFSGRVGPSMRLTADLGEWERSTLTTPTGQSGLVLSGHYRDHWDTYIGGGELPWRFANAKGDELTLRPSPSPR